MTVTKFKTFLISIIMIFCASSVFGVEEYIAKIYKQIDTIFVIKSDEQLNDVLQENQGDRYYYLIENYTEKKIRRLIVNDDYDFAMAAIIVVIENNLDNEQAVEMYSVISDAYEMQRQYEQEQEQIRISEQQRIERAKERQRGNVDKEYIAAKNATTGNSVYVSGKETKLSSYLLKGFLGMVDFSDIYEKSNNLNAMNYGVSASMLYEYTLNDLVFGFDLYGAIRFLGIGSDDSKKIPLLIDAEVAPKFALSGLSKNLFARVGFGYFVASLNKYAPLTHNVQELFMTPIIGVEMERIKLGNVQLDMGVDYLPGHWFYNDIKFAMGADINFVIPYAELEKVKLNFNIGLKDKLLMKNDGLENRANLILAIGVENVIK